jgi:hypothetical protein
MLLILLFNAIPLFVSWLTIIYNYFIVTTYKSILVMLILSTDFKVIAIINTALGAILFNLIFLVLL